MKSIIAFIVFGLIFLAIIVMVVIYFSYKGVRKLKEEVEESYYRNQRMKEQKERNPFGNDYFKSATTTKKAQPKRERVKEKTETYQEQPKKDKNPFGDDYFKSETEAKAEKAQKAQKEQAKKENTARSKPADSGVTIVDEREDKRKIFDHTDGEYVEFEEV